jgi:glycogen operon protein
MSDQDWNVAFARALGVFLNGDGIQSPGPRGDQVVDDSFYVLFNAGDAAIDFVVPTTLGVGPWRPVLDTTHGFARGEPDLVGAGTKVRVDAHGLSVLIRPREG